MATNENNSDPDVTNESSAPEDSSSNLPEKHDEGLTAEEAANRPYDGVEVWSKSKNSLLIAFGLVALAVAGFTYFKTQDRKVTSDRSSRFLTASEESEGAEKRFLSFAEDYNDPLGGVASFRAAAIQYKDKRYTEAATNFSNAAKNLSGDPLAGRAKLGQAVSLIKGGEAADQGFSILREIAEDRSLLDSDRAEARYLLAVQALADEDEDAFSSQLEVLGADVNASYFHSRLVELSKTRKLLASAESLADLNLERGRSFLEGNKKREDIVSLESGLQYEVLQKGDGASPLEDDEVEVHYHGTLLDGQVFDSSIERDEPAKFKVNNVIKGWLEALQLMKVGDKWKIFVPADLAYAEDGSNSIGPNETLTFEVELIAITPKEIPEPPFDANATDANSSSVQAPLVIPEVDANATVPVVEKNATVPADANGSK